MTVYQTSHLTSHHQTGHGWPSHLRIRHRPCLVHYCYHLGSLLLHHQPNCNNIKGDIRWNNTYYIFYDKLFNLTIHKNLTFG